MKLSPDEKKLQRNARLMAKRRAAGIMARPTAKSAEERRTRNNAAAQRHRKKVAAGENPSAKTDQPSFRNDAMGNAVTKDQHAAIATVVAILAQMPVASIRSVGKAIEKSRTSAKVEVDHPDTALVATTLVSKRSEAAKKREVARFPQHAKRRAERSVEASKRESERRRIQNQKLLETIARLAEGKADVTSSQEAGAFPPDVASFEGTSIELSMNDVAAHEAKTVDDDLEVDALLAGFDETIEQAQMEQLAAEKKSLEREDAIRRSIGPADFELHRLFKLRDQEDLLTSQTIAKSQRNSADVLSTEGDLEKTADHRTGDADGLSPRNTHLSPTEPFGSEHAQTRVGDPLAERTSRAEGGEGVPVGELADTLSPSDLAALDKLAEELSATEVKMTEEEVERGQSLLDEIPSEDDESDP